MTESAVPAKDSSTLSNRTSESCRCQLLTVLGEIMLDESMPAAGVAFCMANFQKASPVLGNIPAAQVIPGGEACTICDSLTVTPARTSQEPVGSQML